MTSAARRLIVNADDLGLHEDINRGIEQAHKQGIVTGTSVVACGEAFDHAVEILRTCPTLDVGVHLTLVGGERPLCPPEEVPTLVDADGRFPHSYRRFAGTIWRASPAEMRRELDAQIQRVLQAGLKPTHLDSHQHVHVLPKVWAVIKDLAMGCGIRWVRAPRFESLFANSRSFLDPVFRAGMYVATLATTSSTSLTKSQVGTPPEGPDFRRRLSEESVTASSYSLAELRGIPTIGLESSGCLTEAALTHLVETLPPGIFELVTHPGVTTPGLCARYPWGFEWSNELAALTSPRISEALRSSGVRLTRFSEAQAQ